MASHVRMACVSAFRRAVPHYLGDISLMSFQAPIIGGAAECRHWSSRGVAWHFKVQGLDKSSFECRELNAVILVN